MIWLVLLAAPAHSGRVTEPPPDTAGTVTDYHLAVDLQPAQRQLSAIATLTFSSPLQTIELNLVPQAVIESVMIHSAPADHVFRHGTLTVTPPGPSRQSPLRLTIRYRASFTDTPPANTVGIEDPSFGVSATIMAEGTYLSAATPWFPRQAGRGRHRLDITAPSGIIAVTDGKLVDLASRDGQTIVSWDNRMPTQGLALAAGRFAVAREELDGIQLLTFLSPDNAGLAPGYLAAIRRHLAFYRDLLGPYPYPKFAVVENFLPTGYGMPSWTLLGKSVIRLPFILDTSLPHEIVHSWWGNAVEIDHARGNWAEGLTTYLADYLLKETEHSDEAFDYRRKILRDYATLVTAANDIPLRLFVGRTSRDQQAIGYGKGAMVFHMLRQTIGDIAFRESLRRLAADKRGQTAGWDDLERIFSATAGKELRWFFRQWVEQPGAPELSLREVRTARTADGWTVTGVIRQTGPEYRLSLPLRLRQANDQTITHSVELTGLRTPFRIVSAHSPVRLEVDPRNDIFRRLDPTEIPPTINDLFAPRQPLVVVAGGRRELLAAAGDLLKGLHWEAAEVLDEDVAATRQLAGRDLLFLGWPRHARLQPPLPSGLRIDATGQRVTTDQGYETATSGDALFAVLADRRRGHGMRALFQAQTTEQASTIAPKISHYGRYSLLLFANGRNIAKTTWSAEVSPLTHDFPKEPPP